MERVAKALVCDWHLLLNPTEGNAIPVLGILFLLGNCDVFWLAMSLIYSGFRFQIFSSSSSCRFYILYAIVYTARLHRANKQGFSIIMSILHR